MNNFPTSYFTAMIDPNGQIYAFEASGQRIVGVATNIYEEMKSQRESAMKKAEELYKMCVDNGLIKPEPTQEELLKQALSEIQQSRAERQALVEMNNKLVEMIEELKTAPTPSAPSVTSTKSSSKNNGGKTE